MFNVFAILSEWEIMHQRSPIDQLTKLLGLEIAFFNSLTPKDKSMGYLSAPPPRVFFIKGMMRKLCA